MTWKSIRPRTSLESRTVAATGTTLTWKVKTAEKQLLSESPTAIGQEEPRGDSKTLQPANCETEVIKQTTFFIRDRFFNHLPSPQKAPPARCANRWNLRKQQNMHHPFLRKSAVSCENRRFPNALFCRKRRASAKSAKICLWARFLKSRPFSARAHAEGVVLCERACFCLLSAF